MKNTLVTMTALSLFVAIGCGSSGPSGSGTGGASGATGGATGTGGATTATGGSSATGGAGGAGPILYKLTVQNYLNWCDITEDGTKYPASVPPDMSFAPGTRRPRVPRSRGRATRPTPSSPLPPNDQIS